MASSNATKVSCVAALFACSWASAAHAAPSPTDVVVAQRAFDEARDLFRDGKLTAACAKFALSQKLDPKLGTLLNLAICHQKEGKLASAWSEFHDARSVAAQDGKQDRVQFAEAQMAAIGPQLSRFRVHVSDAARARHVVVKMDDAPLDESAYETEIPVDPGPHRVTAEAEGYRLLRVDATASPGTQEIAIADLQPDPLVVTTPRAPASHVGRNVGIGVGVLGLVSAGVGAALGVVALGKRSDAEKLCMSNQCAQGASVNSEGVTFAWGADVAIGVGALAVAAAVVLIATDSGGGKSGVAVSVSPSAVSLRATF